MDLLINRCGLVSFRLDAANAQNLELPYDNMEPRLVVIDLPRLREENRSAALRTNGTIYQRLSV